MEPEYVASDGTGNVLVTCSNVGMEKVEDSGFSVRGGDLDGSNLDDGDFDDGGTEVCNCCSLRTAGLLVLSLCIVLVDLTGTNFPRRGQEVPHVFPVHCLERSCVVIMISTVVSTTTTMTMKNSRR